MEEKPSDKQVCPKCGNHNACESQLEGEFKCWCQGVKLTEDDCNKIKELGFSAECLCQKCIELIREGD